MPDFAELGGVRDEEFFANLVRGDGGDDPPPRASIHRALQLAARGL